MKKRISAYVRCSTADKQTTTAQRHSIRLPKQIWKN